MMKNGTNIVKHATACHMSKAHSFKDDFTAALEGNVKKEIKRNVSKLAEKFGFDEDEAILFLGRGKLKVNYLGPNAKTMASITNGETNDTTDSFIAGNVVTSNPNQMINENGPADEWVTQGANGTHLNNDVMSQSQNHGFMFENYIKFYVFGIEETSRNDTNIHDIPASKNKFNKKENVSIKATCSEQIFCGDLLRFFSYDFDSYEHTLLVIQYKQVNNLKTIQAIYEINYSKECHKILFGNLHLDVLENYVNNVKSIPSTTKGDAANEIFNYLAEKKKLKSQYTFNIQINPKVDSQQSRVQCSIPHFEVLLKDFITYKSSPEKPNLVRNIEIVQSLTSPPRQRGCVSVSRLKQICRNNDIKGFSKLRRQELFDLLKARGIMPTKLD